MYRIGEFSLLKKVTIKTLRYYDKIDLFKPAVIDKYTGYRYYDDNQLNTFDEITKYKQLGFSLDNIKDLLFENNKENIIKNQIKTLTKEINENEIKIKNLKNMLGGNIMKVEYKKYEEEYVIGKRVILKTRDDYGEELEKVKELIDKANIKVNKKILYNFEIGFEEENLDTFIGYTVNKEDLKGKEEYYKFAKFVGYITDQIPYLEIIPTSKCEKFLVGTGNKNDIDNIYQEMIHFAHNKNIQIRGFFSEIYDNNNVEIYVEAYDLNEKNEDYIDYINHYEFTNELDKKLIGKYQIYEILPDIKYMLNINKVKNMLNTKYKELILNDDGTTNFENINWNKNELIINYNNQKLPEPIYKYKINDNIYLRILMNESYEYHEAQRPMDYIYKKEKK